MKMASLPDLIRSTNQSGGRWEFSSMAGNSASKMAAGIVVCVNGTTMT